MNTFIVKFLTKKIKKNTRSLQCLFNRFKHLSNFIKIPTHPKMDPILPLQSNFRLQLRIAAFIWSYYSKVKIYLIFL